MDVAFPFGTEFRSIGARLARQRRGGGFSISGVETIVPSFQAYWEVPAQFIIHSERDRLQWDAFVANMEGGIGVTQVPIYQRFPPRDLRGLPIASPLTARLGDAQTFEHFGFENTPFDWAVLAEDADLRATQIAVQYSDTDGLRPGHKFSFGERLYMVQKHWQDGSDAAILQIKPPLREAVPAANRLNIESPICRMRLSGEDDGWEDDTPSPVNWPSVTFREAL